MTDDILRGCCCWCLWSGVEQVTSDVLGHLMMARDAETGQGLSSEELRDQVMTLLLAGHEVTSS